MFKKNHQVDFEFCESILEDAIKHDKNIFESIMTISKKQSLGQMTKKLFNIGGEYRRNM